MSPDDFVLMLNLGWSLQEIAAHTQMPVKTVEQIIVSQVKAERLTEQALSLA